MEIREDYQTTYASFFGSRDPSCCGGHTLDRATTNQQTLMPPKNKNRTQPVASTSQAPISSILNLRAVVLGAPKNSFFIEASPGDRISTLQENVKSKKPNRLGYLDSAELILWKVAVCSDVLFQAADNPHLISSNLQSYQRTLLQLWNRGWTSSRNV